MKAISEKAAAALSHLVRLKIGGRDTEAKKFVTFAIKSVYESPTDDPEPGLFVEGILAGEEKDFDGEIMDYKSSKPNFQKWNKEFADKTGGKSVGNLRGQHNPQIAAGKFVAMDYDDTKLSIPVTAKVIDPVEADKVREGVYTSFSVGAQISRKWKDASGAMRWTANPFEGSLVDFGCIPMTRGFTYRAADGTQEERQFDGGRRELRKAFEALGKPLAVDQEDRVIKAISGWAVAQKGLYTISGFAQLVQSLVYLRDSIVYERDVEGDASPVTDRITEATDELLECLAAYTQEEVSEEIGKSNPTEEKTVDIKDVAKDLPKDPAAVVTTAKAAGEGAVAKPTDDAVAKALASVNDGLTVLKAAGYTITGPGDDAATKAAKAAKDAADAAKAADEKECSMSADDCKDEKCKSHKGKKAAAATGDGEVVLKRADVDGLIRDRLNEWGTSFRAAFEKDVAKPMSESMQSLAEAVVKIAGEPIGTGVRSGKAASLVSKDAEVEKEIEESQKTIAADVAKGDTVSAVRKIRERGGNRVSL